MTPKKRNPTDATMRNVKAARKRTETLEDRVDTMEAVLSALCQVVLKITEPKKKKK